MGSNPMFVNSEVKGLVPKEVKVNSIDWFEVLGWIPRRSCNNINWCRFGNFDGSDNDDEDDSLSGPVAESEEDVPPEEASVAPSPPETPATPQPHLPPLTQSPPKRPEQRMHQSSFLSSSLMWFELAANGLQAIEYCCRDKDFVKSSAAVMQLDCAFKGKERSQMRN